MSSRVLHADTCASLTRDYDCNRHFYVRITTPSSLFSSAEATSTDSCAGRHEPKAISNDETVRCMVYMVEEAIKKYDSHRRSPVRFRHCFILEVHIFLRSRVGSDLL